MTEHCLDAFRERLQGGCEPFVANPALDDAQHRGERLQRVCGEQRRILVLVHGRCVCSCDTTPREPTAALVALHLRIDNLPMIVAMSVNTWPTFDQLAPTIRSSPFAMREKISL